MDTRARVTVEKAVNLDQLTAELGAALCAVHDDDGSVREIVAAGSTPQQQLEDAVAAHEAVPVPDPDAELASAIEGANDLAELKDALLGNLSWGGAAGRPV